VDCRRHPIRVSKDGVVWIGSAGKLVQGCWRLRNTKVSNLFWKLGQLLCDGYVTSSASHLPRLSRLWALRNFSLAPPNMSRWQDGLLKDGDFGTFHFLHVSVRHSGILALPRDQAFAQDACPRNAGSSCPPYRQSGPVLSVWSGRTCPGPHHALPPPHFSCLQTISFAVKLTTQQQEENTARQQCPQIPCHRCSPTGQSALCRSVDSANGSRQT
jgi:hypothetical protein